MGGLVLALGGCGDDDGGGGYIPPPAPLLYVKCMVTRIDALVVVDVNVESEILPVDDADVDVNGIPIQNDGGGDYLFVGTVAIDPGDDVTLTVTRGASAVSSTLQMPDEPGVQAPTSAGSPYDPSFPIMVQWSMLSPAPDRVALYVGGSATLSGEDWRLSVDGTATQAFIPGNTLWGLMSNIDVSVCAVNETDSLGSGAEAGSVMKVGNVAFSEYFSTSGY